jgi:DHA2 family multidrug resistance protein
VAEPSSSAAGTPAPEAPPPPLHGAPLALLTVAIALATFMEILDTTIVNVSVPSIAGSLGVSPNEGTWTISSYSLASAIMQPLTGWLGRRFGEVRTFVVCTVLFVLCSAFCGLAISMPMLVASRLMQGAVSGPMVPMAQALLLKNYPPEKRGVALGLWAMVVIVAPIFGPIVGGIITDDLSWPWIFYINVPVGVLSALVCWSILRKRESRRVRVPVDVLGLGLLVIGIGSLQFMLDNGNDKDWFNSVEIVAAGVVAVVCITYLIAWELTDRHPVVDLQLFRRRNFRFGVIAVSVGFFGFFGTTVIFPLWLQTTLGYTASWAGLATAPIGIFGLILMPIVGRNMHRMNLRLAATFAFIVFGFMMLWTSTLNDTASFWQLVAPRFFMGLGVAFFFLPLNQILLSNIPPDQLASASGLSNFLRTIGGSISTAITVWMWTHRTDFHHAVLAQAIQGPNWSAYSDQLHSIGIAGTAAFAHARELMLSQARTLAANDVYRLYAFMFWLLTPLIWLTRPPFRAGSAGSAH